MVSPCATNECASDRLGKRPAARHELLAVGEEPAAAASPDVVENVCGEAGTRVRVDQLLQLASRRPEALLRGGGGEAVIDGERQLVDQLALRDRVLRTSHTWETTTR